MASVPPNPGMTLLKLILVLNFSSLLVFSLPATDDDTAAENKVQTCEEVFSKAGLNYSSFWKGAAHGIHSLSLEEIRYFFDAQAPENNKIPTVNIDFRSEDVIHFNAPLWGYEDRFESWALKIMDWFMINNKPYLYETGSNALEKLSHQYHMQEIYERAAIIYRDLVNNPPADSELCSCANDVTANGILKEVVNIARQLKYRARRARSRCLTAAAENYDTYDGYNGCSNEYNDYYDGNSNTRPAIQAVTKGKILRGRGKRETSEDQLSKLRQGYLGNSNKETARQLLSADPWVPGTLAGPDQWISYSAMLTVSLPSHQGITDFATFIYCKLNQPRDHPADLF